MHIDFAPPSNGTYNNSGSSRQLANYMEHEDLERMERGIFTEGFFNLTDDNIYKSKVIKDIDSNIGQLLKTDAKFYAIHVSPSENELRAMGNTEQEKAEAMKRYIREVFIPEYAKNFNKELSASDIKFYGKIHFERSRSNNELNMHCHLIISRKDQANKKSIAGNAWVEDVISNLELRFGVKSDGENLVSFQQNSDLEGLEYLSILIDAKINHQPLEVSYTTHSGVSSMNVFHPYYMKQYNNRWFIFGRIDGKDYIVNRSLDRIEGISRSDAPFRKNDLVNFNSYFDDIVGVSVPYEVQEAKTITLQFSPVRFKYVVSKPLHISQKIIDEDKCIVAIKVIPTRELDQLILTFGPDVEVLAPDRYRMSIETKIEECFKKYRSVHVTSHKYSKQI